MAKKQQTEQQPEPQERPNEADDAQADGDATPEKLTRTEAANKVIAEIGDDETTVEALTEKADALFVAGGGGKANHDRMYWEVWRSIETLEAMGYVETEEADIIVRKVRK